jgi:hypothetical protein
MAALCLKQRHLVHKNVQLIPLINKGMKEIRGNKVKKKNGGERWRCK